MNPSIWQRIDPRRSVIARLVWVFLGGFVVVALLTIWAATRQLERGIQTGLGASLVTVATQVSDRLDATVEQRLRELRYVAGLPAFAAGDLPEGRRRLEALQDEMPDFAWIGFVSADGVVRCATDAAGEGTRLAQRSWLLLSDEKPYVGSFRPRPAFLPSAGGAGADERVLDLAVPVRNAAGHLVGVIGAYLGPDWMGDLERLALPGDAAAQQLGVTVYAADGGVLFDSGRSGWTRPPDSPALRDGMPASGSLREFTTDGAAYVTGFMRSRGTRDFDGTGWSVAVRQPAGRAFAPVSALRRALWAWFGFIAIVMAILVAMVAERLQRQLNSVAAAARRIRGGDVVTEMPRLSGTAELSGMTNAVADLVESLREPPPKPAGAASVAPALAPPKPDERGPRPILW